MQSYSQKSLEIKVFVLLIVPIVIYWRDFRIIFNEALNSELSTHILAVPFIVGYLIYRLRYVILASIEEEQDTLVIFRSLKLETTIGIILCVIGYLLRWFGSYSFYPLEYHIISLPIFVSGLVLIIFNYQTLSTMIFPIFYLLFLMPPPVLQAQRAGAILSLFSAQASYRILSLLGIPVELVLDYGSPVINLTKISGETVFFSLDLACSGLYSLIGLLNFTTFSAYISKGSWIRKGIVFTIGFPIIYFLNIFRILILIIIGYFVGVGLALQIFHFLGGWVLLFVGTVLILSLSQRVFNIQFTRGPEETCTHDSLDYYNRYCFECGRLLDIKQSQMNLNEVVKLVFILIISLSLITIEVPVFSLSSGKAEVFVQNSENTETSLNVLPEIQGYDLEFVYRDIEFEKISGQNASLMYMYLPKDSNDDQIWVGLEISPIKYNIHAWEVCLISMPESRGREIYEQVDLRDIHLIENPPLSARYFSFHKKGEDLTQVILYWYTQSEFLTENGYEKMWTKISVIQYVDYPHYYQLAEREILPIALDIVEYWRPISTWSQIGISLATNGPLLIGFNLLIISVIIIYVIYNNYVRKKESYKLYEQISDKEDKIILDIIKNAKNFGINEGDILNKYNDLVDKNVDRDKLNYKLLRAKEIGLLKKIIRNVDDRPYIYWKTIY